MNTSVKQRYILRAIVAGLLTAAGALKAYLPGLSTEDIIDVVVTGIVGTGLYTGIGAASPWLSLTLVRS
jgi:hypothetical protein